MTVSVVMIENDKAKVRGKWEVGDGGGRAEGGEEQVVNGVGERVAMRATERHTASV